MLIFLAQTRYLVSVLLLAGLIGCASPMVYLLDTTITSPAQAQVNSFEDDQIAVSFQVSHDAIAMSLKNKTNRPLKILWTQSNFINVEGQPQGITHMGFQPPPLGVIRTPSMTSVPPGTELYDNIILFTRLRPGGRLKPTRPFFEGLQIGQGQWPEEKLRKTYLGKTFALVLTIETDKITPYRFRFRINDFRLVKSR